jgi:hypothetical protein
MGLVYMHEFMDIDFPTLLIFLWWLKLFPLTWLDFQKYCVHRTLCFSVYLLSQCMLGPFIHMTQRKYVTIIWWPIHVLSMLYRSWCRKINISEIFTGVLCTVGGTLVGDQMKSESFIILFLIFALKGGLEPQWKYLFIENSKCIYWIQMFFFDD